MAETWVINENPTVMGIPDTRISFTSNNLQFLRIGSFAPEEIGYVYKLPQSYNVAYAAPPFGSGWTNQDFRTVTFDEPLDTTTPIGQWFNTNAEKQEPPQTNITLDLSTLSLPTGSHSIQIRLSDDGATKRDSELSNAVTYVVAPQLSAPQNPVAITSDGTDFAFEPVENAESYEVFADGVSIGECTPEPEPTGETWVIKESPNITTLSFFTRFESNNQTYSAMYLEFDISSPDQEKSIYYSIYGGDRTRVYNHVLQFGAWDNEDYRTVYFPEPPTGDLRTWLNNNAELQ